MIRMLHWGCLAALMMLVSAGVPALAAGAIGVIDTTQVMKGYSGYDVASEMLNKYYNECVKPAMIVSKGMGLNKDDLATYKKLQEKVADKDAIAKLEDTSKKNSDRYTALREKIKGGLEGADKEAFDRSFEQILSITGQGLKDEASLKELDNARQAYADLAKKGKEKAALTADEQKDYDQLEVSIMANSAELSQLRDGIRSKLDAEQQRLEDIFTREMQTAISKVAKAQKLSVIINKSVQISQDQVAKLVQWTEPDADITDKVLKALNDNFKPELLQKK